MCYNIVSPWEYKACLIQREKLHRMMIQGKAHWAKIVGEPVGGYPNGKGPKEWSVDIEVDKATIAKLMEAGMDEKYLKTSKDGKYQFIKFVRKELKFDGKPGKPFKIVARDRSEWPQDVKIGNGSVMNVKMDIQEVEGSGAMKPKAFSFQVWEHVPYEGGEEFPVGEPEDWTGDEA